MVYATRTGCKRGQRGLEEKGQKKISRRRIQTHRAMVEIGKTWFTGASGDVVGVEEQDRKKKNLEATSK